MVSGAFPQVGYEATIKNLSGYLAGSRAIQSANDAVNKSLGGSLVSAAGNAERALLKVGATATLVGAGLATALGVGAVKSASSFQDVMTKVDALTNTTTEDTAKLKAGILDMAKRIPKSPDELGTATYFALSSGITSVDEALKLVESAGKAAAVGLGDTKTVVDIVTAAINSYGKENLTAAHATDVLVATVREGKGEPAQMAEAFGTLVGFGPTLGIEFEELAAVLASITNVMGGPGGTALAATELRGILNSLASPSKEAGEAIEKLGVFTSVTRTEVKKATKDGGDLANAQTDVKQSSAALSIAQQKLGLAQQKANDALKKGGAGSAAYKSALVGVQSAQLAVSRASQALSNDQRDLAKTGGAVSGSTTQVADGMASLRAELKDKGLIETLLKLNDAFGDDVEAIGKVFPDVRAYLGFMNAIKNQGEATAEIHRRIAAATGLTDEAFKKTSANFSFQAKLLKNELNVELIRLGDKLIPTLTGAVEKAIPLLDRFLHLFSLGIKGGELKGDLDAFSKAAFGAGEAVRDAVGFFQKLHDQRFDAAGLQGLTLGLKELQKAGDWFIHNDTAIAASLAVAFGIFALTNPVWVGILAGGAIITGLGIMKSSITELETPLLRVRQKVDEFFISFFSGLQTVESLGLSHLFGGFQFEKGKIDTFKADLAEVNRLIGERAEKDRILDEVQKLANTSGVEFNKYVTDSLVAFANLGPGIGDTIFSLSNLVTSYDTLKGHQGAAFAEIPGLQQRLTDFSITAGTAFTGATTAAGKTTTTIATIGPTAAGQGPVVTSAGAAIAGGLAPPVVSAQTLNTEVGKFGKVAQLQVEPAAGAFDQIGKAIGGAIGRMDELLSKTASLGSAAGKAGGSFGASGGDTGLDYDPGRSGGFGRSIRFAEAALDEQFTPALEGSTDAVKDASYSLGLMAEDGSRVADNFYDLQDTVPVVRTGLNNTATAADGLSGSLDGLGQSVTKAASAMEHVAQQPSWYKEGAFNNDENRPPAAPASKAPSGGDQVAIIGRAPPGYSYGPGHADGGIFRRPHLAQVAESGTEAILPLTNAPRSRQILASLSPALLRQMMPAQASQSVFNIARLELPNVLRPADFVREIEAYQSRKLRFSTQGLASV